EATGRSDHIFAPTWRRLPRADAARCDLVAHGAGRRYRYLARVTAGGHAGGELVGPRPGAATHRAPESRNGARAALPRRRGGAEPRCARRLGRPRPLAKAALPVAGPRRQREGRHETDLDRVIHEGRRAHRAAGAEGHHYLLTLA